MSTESCWGKESSKSRYEELEKAALRNNTCGRCNITLKSTLEGALQRHGKVENAVGKIMNAWCYVDKRVQEDKPMYCDLFYYWLGEMLIRDVSNYGDVREVMSIIYPKLLELKNINNCTKTFPKVTKEEFKRLKALYHYTRDYSEVENKLSTEGGACAEEYRTFLKEAYDTYRDRDGNNRCKLPNNHGSEYCAKIEEILRNADRTPKDPSELLPELKDNEQPQQEAPPEETPPAVTPPAAPEPSETTQEEAAPSTPPTPPTPPPTTTPTSTPAAPSPVEIIPAVTTHEETALAETVPAETATPAPVEKFPAAAPGNSLDGRGDSSSHHNGAKPPFLAPEVQTTQSVTTEAQTTQLAVTETWTSEESSNTAVDLSIGVTEGITIPTTPILFATWVVTVFISIVLLLCKYTSLFRGKKKMSPKSKRRKRRSTIEDELNTSLACSDSATEYSIEGSSIASSTTVDDYAAEVDSMEDNDLEDDSSSSLYSTAS